MSDNRELSLDAFYELLLTVDIDDKTVKRNKLIFAVSERPGICLIDGSETARELPRNFRKASTNNLIDLHPVVLLFCSSSDSAGPTINEMRRKVIRLVAEDETMAAILGDAHGAIRYLGCESGFQFTDATDADLALNFELTYVLKPSDL